VAPLPASLDKSDLIKLLTRSRGDLFDRAALSAAAGGATSGPRVVKVVRGGKGELNLEID
jgi:hypothetical protein